QNDLDLALREVGLPEAAFPRRVRELGPGARQRLGLAAALLKDAPALLLDDPLAGVDLREASGIVEILEGFRRRGKAILFATQDVGRAHQLADRVSVLQEGRTALTCSREELRFSNLDKLYLDYMQGDLNPEAGSPFP
ncbi:MAG TPA: ABC transporter ATP-binding protein, partial [Thermoanaerobaculia bacterium]|nr:ABC transporter ATP-binding protein [Thermoanaerobaculia bacterium]